MKSDLCILIQTNDEYEWMWEGIFLSWKLNWNWDQYPIDLYVLTETKDFNKCHPESNFNIINVGESLRGSSHYSTKMIIALNKLKELGYKKVFYIQDDSIPYTSIDNEILNEILGIFDVQNLDCFYIHEHRRHFPFTLKETGFKVGKYRIRQFVEGSRFYYNHGSGIWNIDSLLKLQSYNEGPYENEVATTDRCNSHKPKIYIINFPWYNQDWIHEKGIMKESGVDFFKDLKFRYNWEIRENFMDKFISSFDSSIIPYSVEEYKNLSEDKKVELMNRSHGLHFSII